MIYNDEVSSAWPNAQLLKIVGRRGLGNLAFGSPYGIGMLLVGLTALWPATVAAFEFTDVSTASGIVHEYDQDPGNFLAMDREYPNICLLYTSDAADE